MRPKKKFWISVRLTVILIFIAACSPNKLEAQPSGIIPRTGAEIGTAAAVATGSPEPPPKSSAISGPLDSNDAAGSHPGAASIVNTPTLSGLNPGQDSDPTGKTSSTSPTSTPASIPTATPSAAATSSATATVDAAASAATASAASGAADMLQEPSPLESSVPVKRIRVDLSEQRVYAYQAGELIFTFPASTGRNNNTAVGVFKVLDKKFRPYSEPWGFWMPYWMGIYWVAGLENGFHGLPVLENGRELWGDQIGTPASNGCVVLRTEDMVQLYDWSEVGTLVEIVE